MRTLFVPLTLMLALCFIGSGCSSFRLSGKNDKAKNSNQNRKKRPRRIRSKKVESQSSALKKAFYKKSDYERDAKKLEECMVGAAAAKKECFQTHYNKSKKHLRKVFDGVDLVEGFLLHFGSVVFASGLISDVVLSNLLSEKKWYLETTIGLQSAEEQRDFHEQKFWLRGQKEFIKEIVLLRAKAVALEKKSKRGLMHFYCSSAQLLQMVYLANLVYSKEARGYVEGLDVDLKDRLKKSQSFEYGGGGCVEQVEFFQELVELAKSASEK